DNIRTIFVKYGTKALCVEHIRTVGNLWASSRVFTEYSLFSISIVSLTFAS
ncbi:hypothetical protein L9F63_007702, partial [Diploptera punctata]